jgi:tetratricopeptide (TPR) repeat protein
MTDAATFHCEVAEALQARYGGSQRAPEGWREVQAWHWEQAGAYPEAAGVALEVAEGYVGRLDFIGARLWARRTLELLERLDAATRTRFDPRACALALAVLEFGGQYREGLDYARRMLRAARAGQNRDAEIRALLAVGRMQRELGLLAEAEETLTRARALAEQGGQVELESEARVHLAKVYQLQGRNLEGLQELQLAQEEPALSDDQVRLARVLTGIGDIYRVLGATREALLFYTRALSLEQGRGSLIGQAILREKLALTLLAQGKLPEARDSAEESLRLRQVIGDTIGQARSYSVLGTITGRMGDHAQALQYHEQARALDEQTQNRRGEGVALLHLGDEARALGDIAQAHTHYARALRLAQQMRDQVASARSLERLGDLNAVAGQREAASACWSEALRIRETLGHADEAAALRERIRTGQPPG